VYINTLTPGTYPKEKKLQSKHGESLKSRIYLQVRATVVAVEKQCVTYSECVFVALGIQHANLVLHIVICDMSGSKIFCHIISQTERFSGGKKVIEQKMCAMIFSITVPETFLFLDHPCIYVVW